MKIGITSSSFTPLQLKQLITLYEKKGKGYFDPDRFKDYPMNSFLHYLREALGIIKVGENFVDKDAPDVYENYNGSSTNTQKTNYNIPQESNNTLLYVGIGAVVLFGAFMMMRN